jgi:Domain of unknown function (DUF4304)
MTTKTLVAHLDGLLKPLGFVRQKTTWNRRSASVVEVIDIQVSKAGDAVTVNAGVLDPEVHTILWGGRPSDPVEQPACTVCARIGELIDGRDKWWQLSDNSAAVEAAEKVATHVVPFLERMRTREAMKRWLTDTEVTEKRYPPPIVNLAIIKSLLGETAEACALLGELQKKSLGAWRSRIVEVGGRLGCN